MELLDDILVLLLLECESLLVLSLHFLKLILLWLLSFMALYMQYMEKALKIEFTNV